MFSLLLYAIFLKDTKSTTRLSIIFKIVHFVVRLFVFMLGVNGHIYEMLGLRCASLSAVTKVCAGQKDSCKHQAPNILYMMLPAGFLCFWRFSFTKII
ncbi:hypothetical protein CDL62_15590 [Alkalitalea saponilacus]|nr:hypothetical protein CDL62_15590 [Alkalitalea saponilacus]